MHCLALFSCIRTYSHDFFFFRLLNAPRSALCDITYLPKTDSLIYHQPMPAIQVSHVFPRTAFAFQPMHMLTWYFPGQMHSGWQWVREAHRGAHKSDVWQPGQEVQDNNDGLLLRLPVGDGSHIRWTRHSRQGPENSIRLTRPCRDQAIAVESVIVFKSSVKNHMSVW